MRRTDRTKTTLPISLLAEGRRALVVGGGPVATRKAATLLEAGVVVTVVSPELGPELSAQRDAGRIRHVPRAFDEGDLEGAFLAIAATQDPATNRAVLAACRTRGVLAGAVDAHWVEGDFIMPAIIRRRNVTVSVSTGGQSCGRVRRLKEALARRLDDLVDKEGV
jgi:siroheme synthase-like protein